MRTWNHMLLAENRARTQNARDIAGNAGHVRLLTKQAAPRYAKTLDRFASQRAPLAEALQ